MTRDDIIRMAREADLYLDGENTQQPFWVLKQEELERFAALVAAAEREACAKVADETVCDTHLPTGFRIHGTRAAKAIRARSER